MNEINAVAIRIFMAVVCICAVCAPVCIGSDLSKDMFEWDPDALSGKIMKAGNDFIVLNEEMIFLVDTSFKGKKCESSIMDLNGNSYGRDELTAGRHVFVKGSWSRDKKKKQNVFIAKEIYLLPKGMSEKQLRDNPLFRSPAEPW